MLDMREDVPSHCDIVLTGGRVIDPESGLDGFRNVGVLDGVIHYIGQRTPRADKYLDVSGFVVAPGFIDLHSHAQTPIGHRLQAFDGVTTALELEAGAAPVGDYYAAANVQGFSTNFGFSASWALIRMHVLDGLPLPTQIFGGGHTSLERFERHQHGPGWSGMASSQEISAMLTFLEREITQGGALGIGVLLGYSVRSGRKELLELARLGALLNVPLFVHGRFSAVDEPDSSVEGAIELVGLAAGTGAHIHFCHVNSTYSRSFDSVARVIRSAQREGVKISTEAYPYASSSTGVGSASLHPAELLRKSMIPSDIKFLPTGERIKDEKRLLELRKTMPGGLCVIDYLQADDQDDLAFLHHALTFPNGAIASDAMPLVSTQEGSPGDLSEDWPIAEASFTHPRSAGCFSRVIGPLTRDLGLFSLPEAIRRCTLVPAQILELCSPQMTRKGRIQVGCDADIVVFDPATIHDEATFESVKPSVGVHDLMVHGEVVIASGIFKDDVHAGRAVYGTSPARPMPEVRAS